MEESQTMPDMPRWKRRSPGSTLGGWRLEDRPKNCRYLDA
jgi:hypothetical protein